MGHLHVWEQEVVDLLCYLWKAYKAAPDEEFVVYIKDLKSQCNDGQATYDTIPTRNGGELVEIWVGKLVTK